MVQINFIQDNVGSKFYFLDSDEEGGYCWNELYIVGILWAKFYPWPIYDWFFSRRLIIRFVFSV